MTEIARTPARSTSRRDVPPNAGISQIVPASPGSTPGVEVDHTARIGRPARTVVVEHRLSWRPNGAPPGQQTYPRSAAYHRPRRRTPRSFRLVRAPALPPGQPGRSAAATARFLCGYAVGLSHKRSQCQSCSCRHGDAGYRPRDPQRRGRDESEAVVVIGAGAAERVDRISIRARRCRADGVFGVFSRHRFSSSPHLAGRRSGQCGPVRLAR